MGACEQARMWKRLKLILYKKKVVSAFQRKNLTCPVDRDHLYMMKSRSKFRVTEWIVCDLKKKIEETVKTRNTEKRLLRMNAENYLWGRCVKCRKKENKKKRFFLVRILFVSSRRS